MAASNALTIQITGDESDLKKTLELAAKQISKFKGEAEGQGKKGGEDFGSGFAEGARGKLRLVVNQFREIETAATGGFSGVAEAFLTKLVNPVTVGAAAIGASIIGAFAFARIGEENNRIAATFKRFATDAGLDADRLKERISGIAEGFVDLEDVLPRAGEAVLALGKNANRLPDILALARNIGVQTGRDVTQVFEELTKGIENQNLKLLRNNSIRLDGDRVLQEYAKSQGVAVNQLSEAAKQQAFLNAALEQGQKKFGDVGAEVAPIQGGIKKLGLAFDDLKDAIAAVVNSGLGEFFASTITGTANAIKTVLGAFDKFKSGPATIAEDISKIESQLTRLNELKLSNLNTNQYDQQITDLKTKLESLKVVQDSIDKANADRDAKEAEKAKLTKGEMTTGETPEQAQKRIEQEQLVQQRIRDLQAETRLLDETSRTDYELRKKELDATTYEELKAIEEEKKEALKERLEGEYQLNLEKNQKIKNANERAAAEALALAKKNAADRKLEIETRVKEEEAKKNAIIASEKAIYGAISAFAADYTALAKAASVAQAIRNTYEGASRALKDYPAPFSFAVAGLTVATGLAQVAKITAANSGALVTGGQPNQDTNPFLLSKGEIVAPAKSFDEVVEGTARQRGFVKAGDEGETNSLLRELIGKLDNRAVAVTVNTDVVADDNGINKLVERIRDAIDFNAAPSLG
jgi:hypothetical protein